MEPNARPYSEALSRLKAAALRPTRQRLALAKLLFDDRNRHVTAEQLHSKAQDAKVRVSLATVYNTLHQFTAANLLREVVVDAQRSYFDTNVAEHHHFYHPEAGSLVDIPGEAVSLAVLPTSPPGTEIERVDVIVRLRPKR